jgi:diguanylate cyclase (GGDEF)-like protein
VDEDAGTLGVIEAALDLEGYRVATARHGEQALRDAVELAPDLIILDARLPGVSGVDVCRRLRASPRTASAPVILVASKSLSADRILGMTAGADDYLVKPFDVAELAVRVGSSLRRARMMREMNPLSGFPGNPAIVEHLRRRIVGGEPFALLYADLDNFKAYNDHYGFARGDGAIRLLGEVLYEAVTRHAPEDGFIGHVGGDDFILVCRAGAAERLAQEVVARFDAAVPGLYDAEDGARGTIRVTDRRGEVRDIPLLSVSIGIVSTEGRSISSDREVSALAVEMKKVAKSAPGSSWAVDRRRA